MTRPGSTSAKASLRTGSLPLSVRARAVRRSFGYGFGVLAVGAVALVPSTGAAAVQGTSGRVHETSVSPCTTAQLVVWLDTQGSGAAGSVYYQVEFTNQGAHACSLLGYPGVSAVNLAGQQLGTPANKNVTTLPKTITVGVAKTVSATLQITDTGVYAPSICRPVQAAGIRVYPPGQRAAKIAPYPFMTCGAGRVTVHIGAVGVGVLPR